MTLAMELAKTAQRISLVEPLPGFPIFTHWTLDGIDPDGVLYSLRSVDEPGVRFVLTPSDVFFPGYDRSFAAAVAASLAATPLDVEVLLVLTVGSSLQTATANLRAPVVIAPATGRAVQVVLDDVGLPMHAPLVAQPV